MVCREWKLSYDALLISIVQQEISCPAELAGPHGQIKASGVHFVEIRGCLKIFPELHVWYTPNLFLSACSYFPYDSNVWNEKAWNLFSGPRWNLCEARTACCAWHAHRHRMRGLGSRWSQAIRRSMRVRASESDTLWPLSAEITALYTSGFYSVTGTTPVREGADNPVTGISAKEAVALLFASPSSGPRHIPRDSPPSEGQVMLTGSIVAHTDEIAKPKPKPHA